MFGGLLGACSFDGSQSSGLAKEGDNRKKDRNESEINLVHWILCF